MPAEIVFTSVPRGLDGGSGTQPVRRTKDMNPSLAERLKIVSGYSHPFRQGDVRNPVVFFHRIERLAGGKHHVLARMCDAGSDHTGRSNYLGHLLALESAAVATKKAGPAAVAMKYEFEKKWSGAPEERDPPVIIGCTEADPAPCAAWAAAGLEPGIAGDLAEAAMEGKEVCLITPAGQADPEFVLRLFADALRLVQPAARWKVTFNTCEIEPFDATWRAVRADLPQAREMRERGGRLIDLTAGARGSDGPYAAFARGEATSLPWQPKAGGDKPAAKDAAAASVNAQAAGTDIGKEFGQAGPGGRATKKAARAPQGETAGTKRKRRFPVEEEARSRIPWPVYVAIPVALLLMLTVGTVGVLKPEWIGLPSPEPVPMEQRTEEIAKEAKPDRPAELDTEYAQKKRWQDLRKQFEELADKQNQAKIREGAESLRVEIAAKRQGPPLLKLGSDSPDDPDDVLRKLIEKCNSCDTVHSRLDLDQEKPSLRELEEALASLRKADEDLAAAKRLFEGLLKAELAVIAAEKERDEKKKTNVLQEKAYESLTRLATHAVLPSPQEADIDDASSTNGPIDLGEFPVAHLIDLKFALAVPRDEYQGKPFIAQVTHRDATKNEWFIEFQPPAVEGALEAGSNKPRPLAKITVVNDRLFVALTDPPSNNRPQALLRRCVLLVSATKPEDKGAVAGQGSPEPADKPHKIRFVKPTTVGPLRVDPFASAVTKREIPVPPGITSVANGATLKLPIASCGVKAKFVGKPPVDRQFPAAPASQPSSGVIADRVPLTPLWPGAELVLETAITLADATLTIKPTLHGPNANKFPPMDVIKEKFLNNPERNRDRVKKAWEEKVIKSEGMKDGAPKGMSEQKLVAWFGEPFAVEAKMGVAIPGHATIKDSLDMFLKEEFRLAAEKLNRRREAGEKNVPADPREPKSFDDWLKKDLLGDPDPENWRRNFQDTVKRWWAWFEPQLETAWDGVSTSVQQVNKAMAEADCRIEAITSFAYDAAGNEYPVPLVVFDDSPRSVNAGSDSGAGVFLGLE